MFVKWECDCFGLLLSERGAVPDRDGVRTRSVVVNRCDADLREGPGFSLRSACDRKSYTQLTDDEARRMLAQIDNLMDEGWQLRKVKQLLSK
jgi:hypothetical protein